MDLSFDDLEPRTKRFSIGKVPHVLREATGDAACKFRNAILRGTRLNAETGKPERLDGVADAEPLLVSLCLFRLDGEKECPVPLGQVRSWPQRVQKQLFAWVKENSDLSEGEDDTEESLQRQLAELQTKLDRVRLAKKLSKPTDNGSVSGESMESYSTS